METVFENNSKLILFSQTFPFDVKCNLIQVFYFKPVQRNFPPVLRSTWYNYYPIILVTEQNNLLGDPNNIGIIKRCLCCLCTQGKIGSQNIDTCNSVEDVVTPCWCNKKLKQIINFQKSFHCYIFNVECETVFVNIGLNFS